MCPLVNFFCVQFRNSYLYCLKSGVKNVIFFRFWKIFISFRFSVSVPKKNISFRLLKNNVSFHFGITIFFLLFWLGPLSMRVPCTPFFLKFWNFQIQPTMYLEPVYLKFSLNRRYKETPLIRTRCKLHLRNSRVILDQFTLQNFINLCLGQPFFEFWKKIRSWLNIRNFSGNLRIFMFF
jgi:hypothetical protein